MEGASNYVIWKSRIEFLLDEHDLKALIDSAVAEPLDAAHLRALKKNIARAKRLILDGVKDHIVPHIATKNTAREMWVGLENLYQGSSEQRKIYLEENMRNTRIKKGERIDSFLSRIQGNRDQLSVVGSTPKDSELVRLTLNSVSEDYQVFVQSILGREKLPAW